MFTSERFFSTGWQTSGGRKLVVVVCVLHMQLLRTCCVRDSFILEKEAKETLMKKTRQILCLGGEGTLMTTS